jgi:peptide/nickel transport system substrate-binding protein
MKSNRVKLILFGMMFLLLSTFPRMTRAGDEEIRVALAYEPSTINIIEMKTGIDMPASIHVHEALLFVNSDTGEYSTEDTLTESYKILPDGKSIEFKLRKNAIFHTGDPVTAHDVKFTYEECVNPRNANMMSGTLDEIEDIEVVDNHTVIFHLYEPYAAWRELFWIGIASKKYYDTVGFEKFRTHPVGSGPLKFVERKIGEYIKLERFEQHPTFRPQFKKLTFMIVPDEMTRVYMLKIGQLDMITDINPMHLKVLENLDNVTIKRENRTPSFYGMGMRVNHFPAMKEKDGNLVKAVRHAINRQEIIDRVFMGEGYPLYMYNSRVELGYDPEVVFEYDVDKAKRLLANSAYVPGTPMILTYTNALPNANIIAAMLQKYISAIGITVKLQQLESSVQATYSRNRDPREGHMVLYAWAGTKDPSSRLLLSILSTSMYASYSTRPSQKEVDALTIAQAREMDQTKRKAILKKLHQLINNEPSGVYLFGLNQIYAHSNRIDYHWVPSMAFPFHLAKLKVVQ